MSRRLAALLDRTLGRFVPALTAAATCSDSHTACNLQCDFNYSGCLILNPEAVCLTRRAECYDVCYQMHC